MPGTTLKQKHGGVKLKDGSKLTSRISESVQACKAGTLVKRLEMQSRASESTLRLTFADIWTNVSTESRFTTGAAVPLRGQLLKRTNAFL